MIYEGELRPSEERIEGDPEYERLCRQSLQEIDAFTAKLSEDMRREFDQLMEHYLELVYLEKADCYSRGFCAGAGIMSQVFYGQDSCL